MATNGASTLELNPYTLPSHFCLAKMLIDTQTVDTPMSFVSFHFVLFFSSPFRLTRIAIGIYVQCDIAPISGAFLAGYPAGALGAERTGTYRCINQAGRGAGGGEEGYVDRSNKGRVLGEWGMCKEKEKLVNRVTVQPSLRKARKEVRAGGGGRGVWYSGGEVGVGALDGAAGQQQQQHIVRAGEGKKNNKRTKERGELILQSARAWLHSCSGNVVRVG